MQRPNNQNAFDAPSVEALMEHYRTELLRYQRATPPGRSTLAQSLQEITAARVSKSPVSCGGGCAPPPELPPPELPPSAPAPVPVPAPPAPPARPEPPAPTPAPMPLPAPP
ncbi:MAG: hypothetical protein RR197_04335, partial [Oscillospiraceae bacterium]